MLIGIVADDLTGAADAVAPFAARGLAADVQWAHEGTLMPYMDATDARAWSTGTRDFPADQEKENKRVVVAATKRLQELNPQLIFKKIDSTLRGHLRLELDAMRAVLPQRIAIVCPAFPQNGRTVKEGMLSAPARAELNVQSAFRLAGDPFVRQLSLKSLRDKALSLSDHLRALHREGVHTLFCDAERDEDLGVIANAVLSCGNLCLPAGSAGLSNAIASHASETITNSVLLASARQELATGPLVAIIGSRHVVTRRQAAELGRRVTAAPVLLRSETDYRTLGHEIARRFANGQRVVLVETPDDDGFPLRAGFGRLLYQGIVEARSTVRHFGTILTGGQTAEGVLSGIDGCSGITIVGESEPGVVLARVRADGLRGFGREGSPLLIKAGGFGDDGTLARCAGV